MSGTRRRTGPLSPFVENYRDLLRGLGYRSETIRGMVKVLGQLDRWMISNEMSVSNLDATQMDCFLAYRRADDYRQSPHRRGLRLLLDMLIEMHVVAPLPDDPLTSTEVLLDDYRRWLIEDRGLAEATVQRYERSARKFLLTGSDAGSVDPTALTGSDVSGYLLAEAGRCSVGAVKGRVAEMRALLRYLFVHGMTPTLLSGAIPPVAGWRETSIPRYFARDDVDALLDTCDRSTALGARNFAMLMLLSMLGLRCIEIARLELDDIDWRSGHLRVRGKARRIDTLPLPHEVGDAVAGYLRDGRPHTTDRHLFQTYRAPIRGIPPDLLSDVVRRACKRAGLPPAGAHRLRHSVATTLLSEGVALADISQVLRHHDLATTAIYAKVDLASLRTVAQPWPGALS